MPVYLEIEQKWKQTFFEFLGKKPKPNRKKNASFILSSFKFYSGKSLFLYFWPQSKEEVLEL